LLAGLFFAASAPLPFLVGWASCSQDILAILFLAAALHAQLSGRTVLALLFSAAALLSKDSAIFFFPALAGMDFVLRGSSSDLRKKSLQYFALALAWGVLNPEVRRLLIHGPLTGQGGYVGLDNPRMLRSGAAMASTLVNFPPTGFTTPWPAELNAPALAALAIVVVVLWSGAGGLRDRCSLPFSRGRVAALGSLLCVVPGLLTILWAKLWFPYYACLPAIGSSLALAAVGTQVRSRHRYLLILAFLGLGIWYRGMDSGTKGAPMERNWRLLSARLKRVESGLLDLHHTLPPGSRLYMDIQSAGETQMYSLLLTFQAPAVWYGDPTIHTFDVEHFRQGPSSAFLFWVTSDFDIFEIEIPSLRVRSPGPSPREVDYQKALRRFSLGLYESGAVDQAVALLLGIRASDGVARDFDRRLAAMLLFAAERMPEATRLRDSAAAMSTAESLPLLAAALGAMTGSDRLDIAAFQAFHISPRDPEAYRYLMNFFSDTVRLGQALRMANHLLAIRPGDEEATLMRDAILAVPSWEQVIALPGATSPPKSIKPRD
jgi:hypothetical protein